MTTIHLHAMSYGTAAVGRLDDGRTAFVEGGVAGDVVEARIVEDRGRFVKMVATSVIEPSPDRVEAPCPYYGACGGCPWQVLSYAAQLRWKRGSVVDALLRIGHIPDADALVAECIPSKREWGYRNKVEFQATRNQGRLVLGLHASGSSDVVAIDRCLLLPGRLAGAPKALQGALRYTEGSEDLGIERVGVRCAALTGDVEVALWTSPGAFPRKPVAKTVVDAVKADGVVRVLVKGDAKQRKVSGVEVLSGKGFWREHVGDHEFAISAPSFFQVNTRVAEAMVDHVMEALEPDGSDRVLDLYSGAGTFTLPLAERAGEVIAVESYGSSVRDLRRNLEREQLWADVVGGDTARELPGLGHFDLAVVDPPRTGLGADVVDALTAGSPRAVAYVSCDPATLARDLARFIEKGWTIDSVTPFDLFPQTFHIETVVVMSGAGR